MTKDTIVLDGETYKKVKDAKTHVYAILDRSGSMSGLEESTLEGFNGFVKKLKGTNTDLTLVLFDDKFETVHENLDINEVPKLDKETYFVRGGTALIDAVCRTLKNVKIPSKDKAVVLVITDGQENSSREYDTKDFKNLVEKLEGKGNWTFTYLGANQDAFAEAQKYGFRSGNVANYQATTKGTGAAFSSMSANTVRVAVGAAMNVGDFFEKDKEKLQNVK